MALMTLKKAKRGQAFLKLGISAPSGAGKTLGSLLLSYGLMKEKYPNESDEFRWGKIAIIDTENHSGELYVGTVVGNVRIGEYNAITIEPPFEVDKYTTAIELCEQNGIEVAIIDSTSHAWSGEGGLLEEQGNIAKRIGNSYTAWREITPKHQRFVEKMLQSDMHIIATMRAKQEYVQEKNSEGRSTVRKLGMEPEQRKGMEYEFTVFFEVNSEHEAFGSKDRTSMFDQKTFIITPEIGQKLMKWLQGADVGEAEIIATTKSHTADPAKALESMKEEVIEICKRLGGSANEGLMTLVKKYTPSGNPNRIKEETKLSELRSELLLMEKNGKPQPKIEDTPPSEAPQEGK